MKAALAILVVAILLCAVMVAQQNQQIRVSLQVPKAGSLALMNPGSIQSQQVSVHVTHPEAGDSVVVQLLARSNSRYRIQAGPSAVRIGRISVAPNAGGSRVMPDAGNVVVSSDFSNLLEGPRISNGGNNGTPDNALVVSVPVEFPQGVSQADLTFRMELLP